MDNIAIMTSSPSSTISIGSLSSHTTLATSVTLSANSPKKPLSESTPSRPFSTFVSDILYEFMLHEATMILYQFQEYIPKDLIQKPYHIDMEHGFFKTENIGFDVGRRLAERMVLDLPKFHDSLEMVKFACKDLWMLLYKRQISSLKTNHRNVYVLHDNEFKPFLKLDSNTGNSSNTCKEAIPFLAFPCGLIRGVLFALGMTVSVSAQVATMPQCTFHIRVKEDT